MDFSTGSVRGACNGQSGLRRLCVRPNVRVEAGPTAKRRARRTDDKQSREAGPVVCRWASPRTRGLGRSRRRDAEEISIVAIRKALPAQLHASKCQSKRASSLVLVVHVGLHLRPARHRVSVVDRSDGLPLGFASNEGSGRTCGDGVCELTSYGPMNCRLLRSASPSASSSTTPKSGACRIE